MKNLCSKLNSFFLFTALSLKAGKRNVTTSAPGLFACEKVSFKEPFNGGQPIKVFASKSHTLKRQTRGNGAAIWIESATKNEFTVCVLEYGDGSNGTAEVNWIALQSEPVGSQLGTTSFNSWTTETQCKRIAFQKVRFLFNMHRCFHFSFLVLLFLNFISLLIIFPL